MRGVLILLVILDHNDIIRNVRAVQEWFLPMTLHVAGFLFLPFLLPLKPLSARMVADHATRYLVPFAFALLGYSVLYETLMYDQVSAADWLTNLGRAGLFADPWSLKTSSGFLILWYLPALLSTVLLAAAFTSSPRALRAAIFLIACGFHLTVAMVPVSTRMLVPQGLLVALYVFPLGLAVRYSMRWVAQARAEAVVPVAAILLLACWTFERGTEVEIATLVVPTALEPLRVLATDLSDLSFFALLVVLSPFLRRVPSLALVGRHSLLIYLFHPILYKPVLEVFMLVSTLPELATAAGTLVYWAGAAASVGVVTAASLLLSILCMRWPLFQRVVTPRGWRHWAPVSPDR